MTEAPHTTPTVLDVQTEEAELAKLVGGIPCWKEGGREGGREGEGYTDRGRGEGETHREMSGYKDVERAERKSEITRNIHAHTHHTLAHTHSRTHESRAHRTQTHIHINAQAHIQCSTMSDKKRQVRWGTGSLFQPFQPECYFCFT